ncbi:MAG: MarR family transcriptional regulator [Planctomycetes bacterium]|nr:MarR family transcriptional regulator [Planctomycetota bacterium]
MIFSLVKAGRAIEQRLEEALARVGLSLAKFGALMHLVEAGEPLTLSECAKKMACVRSNITQLMDRLEADGLVRRVEDPQDRRAVRAAVTRLGAERQAAGAKEVAKVQAELAKTMRQMLALPLSNDARWFELSARACAGQTRSSVGLTHGIAHTLEGPLRQAQPEEDWHHAKLCSVFLWPVMCLNRTESEKWSQLVGDQDLDPGAAEAVLRSLFDRECYEKALPTLVQHWRAVLRDRCTRTNSALVRPAHLRYFQERAFL